MKPKTLRFSALLAVVAVSFIVGPAVPAGAAQGAATQPVGAVLAGLLDALRGRGGPAPSPMPTTPPAPVPPPADVPSGGTAAQTQTSPVVAAPGPASPYAVEEHLLALRYDVGPIDGTIDPTTSHAIMAFQKVHDMARTGQLDDPVADAILGETGFPTPLVQNSDANKVEIDLTRQVLFLYEGGSLSKILPVSTGTASTPTPTGSYRIYRQASGWETSSLGRLYNSQYFVGGYAIHGSLSVPSYPASHGCVRLPMSAAEWFPDHVSIGTPVYVLGVGG